MGGTAPRSWHRTGLLQTEPDQGTPWAHTETKPKSPSPRCIKRNWQMMLAVKTSCLLGIRHEFLPVGRTDFITRSFSEMAVQSLVNFNS